jgi:hypothetical protein
MTQQKSGQAPNPPRHSPAPGMAQGDGELGEWQRLARELGSISEACRRLGIDRSRYYRTLRREGAGDAHPRRSLLAKSFALENKLIALCLEYPDWGCDRLAWYLTLKGDAVSSPTVQKILIRHGLGRAPQRRERTGKFSAG